MTNKEIAKAISKQVKELPPLPIVVQKLLGVVGDETSSAHDVESILRSEQALAGKVLRLVNSSFYGLSRRISTISHAVVILGNSAIRNLALGLSASSSISHLNGPIDWSRFWEHTLFTAIGAQRIAKLNRYPEPEEAFTIGLLHDVGILVFLTVLPDEYQEFCTTFDPNTGQDLTHAERKLFGTSHSDIGAMLLEQWQLPPTISQSIKLHHDYLAANMVTAPLVTSVMLADVLASDHDKIFMEIYPDNMFNKLSKRLNLKIPDIDHLVDDVNEQVDALKEFFSIENQSTENKICLISLKPERRTSLTSKLEGMGYQVTSKTSLENLENGRQSATLLDLNGLKLSLSQLKSVVTHDTQPWGLIVDPKVMTVELPAPLGELHRVPTDLTKEHIKQVIKRGC